MNDTHRPTAYLLSVYLGLLLGTVAGALIGFGIQAASGQAGWSLTVGALGACGGSLWAALRRADGKLLGPARAAPEPVKSVDTASQPGGPAA